MPPPSARPAGPSLAAIPCEHLVRQGFDIIPSVMDTLEIDELLGRIEQLAHQSTAAALRVRAGEIYAARHVLQLLREAADVWRRPPLPAWLAAVLGPEYGLVRVLYFDKPPARSWALPWHKDLTLAVDPASVPVDPPIPVRMKVGVPHIEGPLEVLEQMLTLRLHLDDVTDDNGPLCVWPGSHRTGKTLLLEGGPALPIHARRGDVLAMRPLLAHSSGLSRPGTTAHRRILHFEFAASRDLPHGFRWHDFIT